ncbi:MAG: ribosome-binding factor A [Candidatus Babeliales bacterium]
MLRGFCINRVMLSPDKGHCYVFFATIGGVEEFNEKLNRLKLYKPSLRAALAKEINGRYTPDITFKFDAAQEKTNRVEELLEDLKRKGDL